MRWAPVLGLHIEGPLGSAMGELAARVMHAGLARSSTKHPGKRAGVGQLPPKDTVGVLALGTPWTQALAFPPEPGTPLLLPYQFRMEEIEGFRYRCRVSGARGEGLGEGGCSSQS